MRLCGLHKVSAHSGHISLWKIHHITLQIPTHKGFWGDVITITYAVCFCRSRFVFNYLMLFIKYVDAKGLLCQQVFVQAAELQDDVTVLSRISASCQVRLFTSRHLSNVLQRRSHFCHLLLTSNGEKYSYISYTGNVLKLVLYLVR